MLGTGPPALAVGPFTFGDYEMNYDKPFLTFDGQIALLKRRGLQIMDEDFAKSALSTLSYYDLINRYKSYFTDGNDNFISNVSIEQLYELYLFDKDIQALVIKYSTLVENIFKTKLSYVLSEDFGVSVDKYLNASNYVSYASNNSISFADIQLEITQYIQSDRIKNPSKYYKIHHNHIPPWILLKNVSLGNSINLFKLLSADAKHHAADLIIRENKPYDQKVGFIERAMDMIRSFRNSAAHNLNFASLRIEKKRCPSPAFLYSLLGASLIQRKNKKIISADRKAMQGLFGVILCILAFLDSKYLKSRFITDLLTIMNGLDDQSRPLLNTYFSITEIPPDLEARLLAYYHHLS